MHEREGEYAPREGIPFVKRKNVAAVIKYENEKHTCIWVKEDKLGEVSLFENHRRMLEAAIK